MKRLAIMLVSAFLVTNARSQTPTPQSVELQAAASTPSELPEPASRQQFKILSKAALKEVERESKNQIRAESLKFPLKPDAPKRLAAENIQRLEEIRVFGNAEPEDYVAPKPPPMLVFRAMLDAQRPRTLAEKLLKDCFICPQNPPREGNVVDRFDAKKFDRPLIIARPRGSLQ